MPDDFEDKTEAPAEHRRAEARRQGNVARSADLTAAGLMLAAACVLALFSLSLAQALAELLHGSLRSPGPLEIDQAWITGRARDVVLWLGRQVLPILLVLAGAATAVNLLQVGFLYSPEVLEPKLSRLNPLEGARRIFSARSLVRLAVSLGKLLLVVVIAAWSLSELLPDFLDLLGLPWLTISEPSSSDPFREPAIAPPILRKIREAGFALAFQLAAALLILALLDFAFQKWKLERDLRMTKQELREELRKMEGDPLIRQRRREVHRKLAEARQLAQVREADVVVTNATDVAVALKYDPQRMPAPAVVAKGVGEIALRIRQIAAEHGVPILERPPLARRLYHSVKPGRSIPAEMHEVFVEIMAYVYRITSRTPPRLS